MLYRVFNAKTKPTAVAAKYVFIADREAGSSIIHDSQLRKAGGGG